MTDAMFWLAIAFIGWLLICYIYGFVSAALADTDVRSALRKALPGWLK